MKTKYFKDTIAGRGLKNKVRSKFPRPCLNCGHMHMHNNAFCSAGCCKQWRSNNPNQGRAMV